MRFYRIRAAFRSQKSSPSVHAEVRGNTRQRHGYDDVLASFDAGRDTDLAGILDAIVHEVQRIAAAARIAIILEYTANIAHAHRYLPRGQIAGAVSALKQARHAALTHLANQAKAEIAARQAAVIRDRARRPRHMPKRRMEGDELGTS